MKRTIVAANQLAACEEGMLPLSVRPMPSGIWTLSNVQNGRGRWMISLSVLQMMESPSATARISIKTQRRPRAPPLQASRPIARMNAGPKKWLPLTNGINWSKNGLLNAGLTQRKKVTSSASAQCIRGESTLNRRVGNESLPVQLARDFVGRASIGDD